MNTGDEDLAKPISKCGQSIDLDNAKIVGREVRRQHKETSEATMQKVYFTPKI